MIEAIVRHNYMAAEKALKSAGRDGNEHMEDYYFRRAQVLATLAVADAINEIPELLLLVLSERQDNGS